MVFGESDLPGVRRFEVERALCVPYLLLCAFCPCAIGSVPPDGRGLHACSCFGVGRPRQERFHDAQKEGRFR